MSYRPLNVTQFTQAEFQALNFTKNKFRKPLISESIKYMFPKLNWPATALPPYISQMYLLLSKLAPIFFTSPTRLILKCQHL